MTPNEIAAEISAMPADKAVWVLAYMALKNPLWYEVALAAYEKRHPKVSV